MRAKRVDISFFFLFFIFAIQIRAVSTLDDFIFAFCLTVDRCNAISAIFTEGQIKINRN